MHDIRMAAAIRNPYAPQHNMYTGIENPMLLQKNHRYEHNMYHTIHFKPKVYQKQSLKRNCISMENLKVAAGGGYNSNTNSLARSSKGKSSDKKGTNNQCLNISSPMPLNNSNSNNMSSQYFHMPFGYIYDRIDKKGSGNKLMSKSNQSLGTNASSDDCFRYRDVAL